LAKATMRDVEAAYHRGAQQAAILLLQGLSGDRGIERKVRYLDRLGRWRFGASLSSGPRLPKPTLRMMQEFRRGGSKCDAASTTKAVMPRLWQP
jgi:hypothetical protein